MKRVVILTGSGMSAESGIKTFRGNDGFWEGHNILEVASPKGFAQNPELVLEFYNQRRAQLFEVKPNEAHKALIKLEAYYDVEIITQNVDDLHERAGSKKVIHLHGELRKVSCTKDANEVLYWEEDLQLGDMSKNGCQLRPHIVWFGESVPKMVEAIDIISKADIVVIVGTSMLVYPAASLIGYAPKGITVYYVDPKPSINRELESVHDLLIIDSVASIGVVQLVEELIKKAVG